MRILKLFYKNINSLEGEGQIDFAQGPIAESGVFAITGPNGSGKSSILDVITLALYGETFRFHKPAEHVITKQADDSIAEIEFAIAGQHYRSHWEVNRNNLSLPAMHLSQITSTGDENLADNPAQVRQKLAEITGMDFHKFSKSMVLPQGDFAAFLNALDSERMDILEKISGADLYSNYRIQAENQLPIIQTKVSQLEQDLALIPLLNQAQIEAAEHDLQDFAEQAIAFKAEQQTLNQQAEELEQIERLTQQRHQLDQQHQTLNNQLETLAANLDRIRHANNPQALKQQLVVLDQHQTQLEQTTSTLNGLRQELAQLQQQLAAETNQSSINVAGKNLAEIKQSVNDLNLKITELNLKLPEQTQILLATQQQLQDKQAFLVQVETDLKQSEQYGILITDFPDIVSLRNLRTEIATLSRELKGHTKNTKAANNQAKKTLTALNASKTRIEQLNLQISSQEQKQSELAQGKQLDELKELQLDQQVRVQDFQNLLNIAETNARLTKKAWYDWFSRNSEPEWEDETEIQVRVDHLKTEISREENISKVLELAIVNENLIKKMTAERSKLHPGKPCHLCGSTEHPFLEKLPQFNDSKRALVDQRAKIHGLKTHLQALTTQLNSSQKRSAQQKAKDLYLQQKRSDWTLLANRLNILATDIDITRIGQIKKLLSEENDELSRINNLIRDYLDLQRNIDKAKTELTNKQTQIKGLIISEPTEEDLEQSPADQEILAIEQSLNAAKQAEKTLLAKLETQLTALGEKLPAKGKENLLFDKLNSRRQDLQILQLRQTGLNEEIKQLQQQLQTSHNTVLDLQQQLNSQNESLLKQQWLSLQLLILEKQQLISQQEQQLKLQQLEFEALEKLINSNINENGFGSLSELQSLLALIERQPQLQQQFDSLIQQLQQINSQSTQIEQQLQQLQTSLESVLSSEEINLAQRQLAAQLDICQQEITSLENKLAKQQQYRDKYQSLETELTQQYRLLAQAQTELDLINDPQGGLKRRIQQLLIDKLLAEANRILEKINGRYYLRSAPSDHGLALEIEDSKQKNQRRLPKSLSGGESFVVSLSLALALAEIANNGQSIDSLFLDEGFGNLDAESLYLAMGALEGLSIQGKTVGVISHVDGVKKRIKTQIELVKKPNGLSELKLVA